ncbi:hypothetical protein PUN28_002738 [Cardiocondyla obscurior]|uniref:Uncharacterized protein n=1 Tax=Cardiocondyla obscurior TaxID=286306 RepID=A0AAW2GVT5_9HYME
MVFLHDEEYYQSRIPETDLGAFRNFLRFVWNSDKKHFLGRTGKEWALLGLFYLCFFTVLGSLFTLQMWISIEYALKLEKPYFFNNGLTTRFYFDVNPSLFRRLHFNSPGIFSLIQYKMFKFICLIILNWVPIPHNKSFLLPKNMPRAL